MRADKNKRADRAYIKQLLEQALRTKGKRRLCREMEIPISSIYNYLDQATEPSIKTLTSLSLYFNIPITDLLLPTDIQHDSSPDSLLTSDEIEVINMYREIPDSDKNTIKAQLRFFIFEHKSQPQRRGAVDNDKKGAGITQ